MQETIIATDPTALYISIGNVLGFLGVLAYHLKKYINTKNGDNPHPTKDYVDDKFKEYKESSEKKFDLLFRKYDSIQESFNKIDKNLAVYQGVMNNNLERIDKDLNQLSP